MIGPDVPFGLAAHFVLRPLLAGLIVATAMFFASEYICRAYVWPALLAGTRIAGNPRLWRARVSHRLLVFWLAISALPLGVVALTTYTRVAGADAEPIAPVTGVFLAANGVTAMTEGNPVGDHLQRAIGL